MVSRSTRGTAAKEAAFIASSEKENTPRDLSPLSAASVTFKKSSPPKNSATKKATELKGELAETPTTTKSCGKTKLEDKPVSPTTATKKRKRGAALKTEEDTDELLHNLGTPWKVNEKGANAPGASESGPAKKKEKRKIPIIKSEKETAPRTETAGASDEAEESPAKKSRKQKANPYGLTPGISPFPDWPHPTPEECQQVNDLLSSIHGTVKAPETIPEPSATVAGCGEVPSVLDALIRTLLSAATSGRNSSRAFQGLIEEYGRKRTGVGKGSVDWDAVRHSDVSRVFNAIKSGGLADVKSKKIKLILDMVHEENQARRQALVKTDGKADAEKASTIEPKGAKDKSEEANEIESQGADEEVLTLDYLHTMPSQESFNHMLKYPGIGVKTASCVTMFCLRRPSFAVDTHVFRLCQWLGWVPEKANRDTTFMHCEVMVPDKLKYSLHQLLIQHGKKCGRCRAITGESSEGWGKGCVIDHLVKRTGARKGGTSPVKVNRNKKVRKGTQSDEDGEDEDQDIDMSDGQNSNAGKPARRTAKRVTPRKTHIKAKKEEELEESDENGEEEQSDGAESDFKPPARKATIATSKKGGRNQDAEKSNLYQDVCHRQDLTTGILGYLSKPCSLLGRKRNIGPALRLE
ncbi:MAG: hypothetical protein Q9221_003070 [Calogaya cf. arnoldii]